MASQGPNSPGTAANDATGVTFNYTASDGSLTFRLAAISDSNSAYPHGSPNQESSHVITSACSPPGTSTMGG